MKTTLIFLLATGALTFAAPAPPPSNSPSMASATADMVNGANQFSSDFLAGDMDKVAKDLEQMINGAVSFTPGFFGDLGKSGSAVAAAGSSKEVGNALAAAAPPSGNGETSMASALEDMITGALSYPGAYLSGDKTATQGAVDQMTKGAEGFPEGFFNDLGKAGGAAAAAAPSDSSLKVRQAAPAPADYSMVQALEDMIGGATSIPQDFLSGDMEKMQQDIDKMTKGAAGFPEGFFNDMGKAGAAGVGN
ncbi:hypothetical protein K402DRAFT_458793 [Aulographum hederae CBS 113979]|uniref:Uncharacterized protein n=1 Tax=Aulographum hederae CBS 113979 TaxID=1176131 RepID=A0A6G1HGM6_9PEZI|nr:hypothetical protein K402DRAFT_458793 [Aulographum hederae CBS 113979]